MTKSLITDLDKIPWLRHGFFLKTADAGDVVAAFGAKELALAKQVHSARAVYAAQKFAAPPEADAVVTDRPGVAVGVVTADCVPILLADKKARVVAAAHAGWHGALDGVLAATVAEMAARGAVPANIHAAIGPCIRQASYEVTEGFEKPFVDQDAENARFFTPGKPGHLMFDLPGYVAACLRKLGIKKIFDTRQDTLPAEPLFASYRRATLRGVKEDVRQISAIMIDDTEGDEE